MKRLFTFVLLLSGILVTSKSFSDIQADIDSMKLELHTSAHDTDKVYLLNNIAQQFLSINPDSAEEYSNKALKISQGISYSIGISSSYTNLGRIAYLKGDYTNALVHFQAELQLNIISGNTYNLNRSFNNMGNMFLVLGKLDSAELYYRYALDHNKELGSKGLIANAYNNLGAVNYYKGNFEKAMEYYIEGLKTREEMGIDKLISESTIIARLGIKTIGKLPSLKNRYFYLQGL